MRGALPAMVVVACLLAAPASGEPLAGLLLERRALADLGAGDAVVRAEAAAWLGRWGRTGIAVDPLIDALRVETSSRASGAMAEALGRLDAKAATPVLVDRMNATAEKATILALSGLGNADAQRALIAAMPNAELGPLMPEALARIGAGAIPLIVRGFREAPPHPRALETLGLIGSALATPELVERVMEGNDEAVVVAALDAIASIGDPRAGRATRARLDDSRVRVRVAALGALARVGDGRDVDRVETLARESVEPTRSAALMTLLSLAPTRALEPLTLSLIEGPPGSNADLLAAALRSGDPALAPLYVSLIDAGHEVPGAAMALSRLRAGAGLPPLLERAEGDDERALSCRIALAVGLRTTGYHLPAEARAEGLALLGRMPPGAERRLLRGVARDPALAASLPDALRSEDPVERATAGRTAELLGDADLIPPLVEALRVEQNDEAFRRLASAATALDAPVPIARLVRWVHSETTSPEAMILAAGQIERASPRSRRLAREFFRSGLRSHVPRVRAGAARALAIAGDREAYRALRETIEDDVPEVRRAGARALEVLAVPAARPALLGRARIEADPWVRAALLDAARAPRARRLGRYEARGSESALLSMSRGDAAGGPSLDVVLSDGRWLRFDGGALGQLLLVDLPSGEAVRHRRAGPTRPRSPLRP